MHVLHFDACAQVSAAKFIDKANNPRMTDAQEYACNAIIWTDIGIISLLGYVGLRYAVLALL